MIYPIVTPAKRSASRGPGASARWTPAFAGVTIALVVAVILSLSALALALARDTGAELRAFAQGIGLAKTEEFVETIISLRESRHLPPRYVTKKEAAALGWKPGADLCRTAPGRAIGGDAFGNREKRLPEAAGRRWREADLDYACGQRNAKRLVWSSDGLIFVTVDHYTSFREVPK